MRFYALDVARLGAAISVMLYHYISERSHHVFPNLAFITDFGYLGVPFFFMISGFVIFATANNRSCLDFASSRITRLYPAYWISIAFVCVVLGLLSPTRIQPTAIAANLTMLNDYLDIESIDGVYWTLHAELKFYACVFLLLIFGQFHRYRIWLSLWLGMTLSHTLWGQPDFMGWFISPTYSCFFIAGVAFYLIKKDGLDIWKIGLISVSLALSLWHTFKTAGVFLPKPDQYAPWISVFVTFSFFVIFALIIKYPFKPAKNRVFLWIGGMTYPLYLIHNVAGKAIFNAMRETNQPELVMLWLILFMLCASLVMHLWLEIPLVRACRKLLKRALRSGTRKQLVARGPQPAEPHIRPGRKQGAILAQERH